jgi:titin
MSASVPGVPRNVDQDGESKTTIGVKWEAPGDSGGAAITDYVVEFRKQGASAWTVFADGVSDAKVATVKGLSSNTTYDFRVAAVNRVGTGGYSGTLSHATDK